MLMNREWEFRISKLGDMEIYRIEYLNWRRKWKPVERMGRQFSQEFKNFDAAKEQLDLLEHMFRRKYLDDNRQWKNVPYDLKKEIINLRGLETARAAGPDED